MNLASPLLVQIFQELGFESSVSRYLQTNTRIVEPRTFYYIQNKLKIFEKKNKRGKKKQLLQKSTDIEFRVSTEITETVDLYSKTKMKMLGIAVYLIIVSKITAFIIKKVNI